MPTRPRPDAEGAGAEHSREPILSHPVKSPKRPLCYAQGSDARDCGLDVPVCVPEIHRALGI